MISNKAKGLSGSSHVAHTKKLMCESTQRYHHSCLSAGLTIKKTGKMQDIGHVDFIVDGETVDLKGIKNSMREGRVLLEFTNVNGKTGWCNEKGTPVWIAFDVGAFFLHVKNIDLFNLAKEKCDLKDRVTKVSDCLYKGYQRNGRKDWMSMVLLSDVLSQCNHWFLPYQEYDLPIEKVQG
tara:strand:- start:686 stop:1225 length:540 start_codon:yes stop_codon:yes gene_type:complete